MRTVHHTLPARLGALLGAGLAIAALGGSAAPALAHDATCKKTSVTHSHNFKTYWTAEGVGLVTWRLTVHPTAYDRCDHGALEGSVSIYTGVITQKGGSYGLRIAYQTSFNHRWTSAFVSLQKLGPDGRGNDVWNIVTDNNIGLTTKARITKVKITSYLVFNAVPGALRHTQCTMTSRSCSDGNGG
jgi:hypothetical protein